jgi:TatD DNase family protein
MLPPIDAHAHINVRIDAAELTRLGAVVLAVTRSIAEWQAAAARDDDLTLWGIGCHPALPAAVDAFDPRAFADALPSAAFVGEVGLDGRSPVPLDKQVEVLTQILKAVQRVPRPVSIHSTGATRAMLELLQAHPIAVPILHWWRGTRTETLRALELGCLFSLNGHEAKSPKVIELIPLDRVITETDFPHSRRYDRAADRPGAVSTPESLLSTRHGISRTDLRVRLWLTLATLLEAAPRSTLSAEIQGNIAQAHAASQPDP